MELGDSKNIKNIKGNLPNYGERSQKWLALLVVSAFVGLILTGYPAIPSIVVVGVIIFEAYAGIQAIYNYIKI